MGDHFYSAIPSNTPAQRHFLFAATSQGYVHDGPGPGGLTAKTIWQELDAAGVSWKIYSEETNLFTYLQDFAYFNQPGVSAKVVSITVLQRRWGWPTAGSFVHRDRAARRSFRAHQQL
jgi:phospholipase C